MFISLLIALISITFVASAQESPSVQRAQCREWHECRQLTLDALANGEFERAHDFAWRTVQTGPPRDPALLYLLARAQSLSGRPHDALVMLERLADMGVATDALTSDDFKNVRTLREWPELEAKLRASTPGATGTSAPGATTVAPAEPTGGAPTTAKPAGAISPPAVQPSNPAAGSTSTAGTPEPAAATPEPTAQPAAPAPAITGGGGTPVRRLEDALRVPDAAFKPQGLAYDNVSARFVVADPAARKLVILDERSRRVVDLVRGSSAGFSDITAFEIDPRRGDLWVASDDESTDAPAPEHVAALHKLQLVSGRPLATYSVPEKLRPARLQDVAITAGGTIFLLDSLGGRILAFHPETRTFAVASTLTLKGVTSIAPADEHTVYVAHDSGVARVDVATGNVAPLQSSGKASLAGFRHLRWAQDSLVGVQAAEDGAVRAVTIRLAGNRAVSESVVESDVPISDPTAATMAGDELYVLTRRPSENGGASEFVVQRVRVR